MAGRIVALASGSADRHHDPVPWGDDGEEES